MDHALAFDKFRRAYRKYDAMEQNKAILQEKASIGQKLGREVNGAREKVNMLKKKLEALKRENAVNNIVEGVEREDPE